MKVRYYNKIKDDPDTSFPYDEIADDPQFKDLSNKIHKTAGAPGFDLGIDQRDEPNEPSKIRDAGRILPDLEPLTGQDQDLEQEILKQAPKCGAIPGAAKPDMSLK